MKQCKHCKYFNDTDNDYIDFCELFGRKANAEDEGCCEDEDDRYIK